MNKIQLTEKASLGNTVWVLTVSKPSGSIKTWWLSLSENLHIVFMEGQYLGPRRIAPENIAELLRLSFITLAVLLFVYVI